MLLCEMLSAPRGEKGKELKIQEVPTHLSSHIHCKRPLHTSHASSSQGCGHDRGAAGGVLGGELKVLEFHLGSLEDEHLDVVGKEGKRVVQALQEAHLHDADLTDAVSEGVGYASIGDGGGVIPELHCNKGAARVLVGFW